MKISYVVQDQGLKQIPDFGVFFCINVHARGLCMAMGRVPTSLPESRPTCAASGIHQCCRFDSASGPICDAWTWRDHASALHSTQTALSSPISISLAANEVPPEPGLSPKPFCNSGAPLLEPQLPTPSVAFLSSVHQTTTAPRAPSSPSSPTPARPQPW